MDRSTPDDGWNDADGVDGVDGTYPPAPIPAHERQWRHPSEIGQQAWVLSEPPITIGRGLLVATGTVGCALGLAVLWMMLPVGGGAPVAEPVVTRSVDTVPRRASATFAGDSTAGGDASAIAATDSGGGDPSSATAGTEPAVGDVLPGAVGPGGDDDDDGAAPSTSIEAVAADEGQTEAVDPSAGTTPPLTLPGESVPSNTVLLHPDEPAAERAIAVMVGDSSMLVTTARAVEGAGGTADDAPLDVRLDSGATATATLVATDGPLAYLTSPADGDAPADEPEVFGFANAAPAAAGDTLFVLGDRGFSFVYDGSARLADAPSQVVEGTPVVDGSGDLVALCTHDGDGIAIVPVVAADATDAPPASDPSPTITIDPSTTASGSVPTGATPDPEAPIESVTTTTVAALVAPGSSTGSAPAPDPAGSTPSSLALGTSGDPWIGVRLAVVEQGGHAWITVAGIADGSPAATAGLQIGQRIVSIDGRYVDSIDAITGAVQPHQPGDTVVLGVLSPWSANDPPSQPVTRVTIVLGAREPSV